MLTWATERQLRRKKKLKKDKTIVFSLFRILWALVIFETPTPMVRRLPFALYIYFFACHKTNFTQQKQQPSEWKREQKALKWDIHVIYLFVVFLFFWWSLVASFERRARVCIRSCEFEFSSKFVAHKSRTFFLRLFMKTTFSLGLYYRCQFWVYTMTAIAVRLNQISFLGWTSHLIRSKRRIWSYLLAARAPVCVCVCVQHMYATLYENLLYQAENHSCLFSLYSKKLWLRARCLILAMDPIQMTAAYETTHGCSHYSCRRRWCADCVLVPFILRRPLLAQHIIWLW